MGLMKAHKCLILNQLLLQGVLLTTCLHIRSQWCGNLIKRWTNTKIHTGDCGCCEANQGALHACSISSAFKRSEEGLSWLKMTHNVWTAFHCVSECGFTWSSYFISEVPCRVFREFHQTEDIHTHCAVGIIDVRRV